MNVYRLSTVTVSRTGGERREMNETFATASDEEAIEEAKHRLAQPSEMHILSAILNREIGRWRLEGKMADVKIELPHPV